MARPALNTLTGNDADESRTDGLKAKQMCFVGGVHQEPVPEEVALQGWNVELPCPHAQVVQVGPPFAAARDGSTTPELWNDTPAMRAQVLSTMGQMQGLHMQLGAMHHTVHQQQSIMNAMQEQISTLTQEKKGKKVKPGRRERMKARMQKAQAAEGAESAPEPRVFMSDGLSDSTGEVACADRGQSLTHSLHKTGQVNEEMAKNCTERSRWSDTEENESDGLWLPGDQTPTANVLAQAEHVPKPETIEEAILCVKAKSLRDQAELAERELAEFVHKLERENESPQGSSKISSTKTVPETPYSATSCSREDVADSMQEGFIVDAVPDALSTLLSFEAYFGDEEGASEDPHSAASESDSADTRQTARCNQKKTAARHEGAAQTDRANHHAGVVKKDGTAMSAGQTTDSTAEENLNSIRRNSPKTHVQRLQLPAEAKAFSIPIRGAAVIALGIFSYLSVFFIDSDLAPHRAWMKRHNNVVGPRPRADEGQFGLRLAAAAQIRTPTELSQWEELIGMVHQEGGIEAFLAVMHGTADNRRALASERARADQAEKAAMAVVDTLVKERARAEEAEGVAQAAQDALTQFGWWSVGSSVIICMLAFAAGGYDLVKWYTKKLIKIGCIE